MSLYKNTAIYQGEFEQSVPVRDRTGNKTAYVSYFLYNPYNFYKTRSILFRKAT